MADTKIVYQYDFVASLRKEMQSNAIVSTREDGFTTDVSLKFFSKKTIRVTIFEFQFTFSTKSEHGGAFYYQKYAKPLEPSIFIYF